MDDAEPWVDDTDPWNVATCLTPEQAMMYIAAIVLKLHLSKEDTAADYVNGIGRAFDLALLGMNDGDDDYVVAQLAGIAARAIAGMTHIPTTQKIDLLSPYVD